jgi:hypothetical protein
VNIQSHKKGLTGPETSAHGACAVCVCVCVHELHVAHKSISISTFYHFGCVQKRKAHGK